MNEKWKKIYSNAENLVELTFANRTNQVKYIWVEPAAISLELDASTEYKIVTHDKSFTIEYTSEFQITLWTDYSFGFKLYKKSVQKSLPSTEWELDIDMSDIN